MARKSKRNGGQRDELKVVSLPVKVTMMPPSPVQRLFAEALRAQQSGILDKAQKLCLELLKLDVKHAEGLHLLGLVLYQQGRADVAKSMFQRAIAANGKVAAYYSNLGNALHALERHEKALEAYDRAIALQSNEPNFHYNRANTLRDLGQPEEARSAYEKAIKLNPDFAEAHCNLGGLLRGLGRLDDAEAHLRTGLRLKPDYSDATNNLAVTLQDQGRLAESMECFKCAVRLNPNNYDMQYNKAMAHLLAGEFEKGWIQQEIRWKIFSAPRQMQKRQWFGERLNGERVLLHHECGLGDTIQFLRYVPLVAARGGKVVMDMPAALSRLSKALPGVEEVTVTGQQLPEFDLHSPMMSLGLAFKANLENIPAATPYLRVPEEAREKVLNTVTWPLDGLRVGLVWSGNPKFSRDRFRSLHLNELCPVLRMEGVYFYSLQMGHGRSQLRSMQCEETIPHVTDLTPFIEDMADTAALMENLDLIITVDTSVAHLAGALGKPVWIMLPAAPDWRWLQERSDSPWYPSMRLFRQEQLGDWAPVVQRVQHSLALCTGRAAENSVASLAGK
ncbi:MAG: glycosyltransferase family protein [Acidobacteriota bacterium]|nr:glycosyltransferase family protein [Acidobacteriota bacterium]